MEKYIILIVILFLLLLYLNKNIEGNTGNNEIGDTYGWRSGVIEGRKQFSVEDISRSQLILKKCKEVNDGYTPPPLTNGRGCLEKCLHKRPIKNGFSPQRLDGNCGKTLYRDETMKNYKLCPKKCTSTIEEQLAESEKRRVSTYVPVDCINDNECTSCYKDISYNVTGGDKEFKCGEKISCPMALTEGKDADGSGVIFPMDGCGGYTDIDNDIVVGGNGDFGSNGLGSTGHWDKTNSSNNPWKPLGPSGDSVNSEPWEPINETVDCSTYPKHPKCSHIHKPQMFGCINNAKEGEINSMSKPGTLDSSWGLFN